MTWATFFPANMCGMDDEQHRSIIDGTDYEI